MATLTTAQRLAEAQDAYHALVTGKQARVIVDRNGERVEYTVANKQALKDYIAELETVLGQDSSRKTRPLQVYF